MTSPQPCEGLNPSVIFFRYGHEIMQACKRFFQPSQGLGEKYARRI